MPISDTIPKMERVPRCLSDSLKDRTINKIIDVEGEKFTDDPLDSGGPTKWGVTEFTAREWGYTGRMQDLPRSAAYEIYAAEYWDKIRGDKLVLFSPEVAEEVADTAVNCGPDKATMFLQRSLNVLNNRQKRYPDIAVDGDLGPATLRTLNSYLACRSDNGVLFRMLNSLQGAFYVELAERREKDERFVYGWFLHRVK